MSLAVSPPARSRTVSRSDHGAAFSPKAGGDGQTATGQVAGEVLGRHGDRDWAFHELPGEQFEDQQFPRRSSTQATRPPGSARSPECSER
ncbi:hypothetical protein HHX38_13200 [Streptomyces sp. PKU-MA01144]|nr:hypothetical protein [Streptomyces sp. PKU-MA01144]